MAVTHSTVATLADEAGAEVNKNEWNADHAVADGSFVAAKLSASTTDVLFGRSTAGAGNGEEVACTSAGRALIDDASAAAQRTTLGLAIGTDVQAFDAGLGDIAALAVTDGNIVVGDGANWVAESGATARTSLGLGTGDSPQFTGVELGNASDTTLTRASAGNVAIEGNVVYRAGGTDVPVADGGTGASTALGACQNLSAIRVIQKSFVAVTAPASDTNENVIATITLPVLSANDILRITHHWTVTGNANVKTVRVRMDGITGTIFVADTYTSVTYGQSMSYIANRNSTAVQVGYSDKILGSGTKTLTADVAGAVETNTGSVTIVLTAQKATGTDTMTLEGYLVELMSSGA